MKKTTKKDLSARFVEQTSRVISKFLRMKGLIDEDGRPIDNGAEPLDMIDGRVVIVTEGVTVEDKKL